MHPKQMDWKNYRTCHSYKIFGHRSGLKDARIGSQSSFLVNNSKTRSLTESLIRLAFFCNCSGLSASNPVQNQTGQY